MARKIEVEIVGDTSKLERSLRSAGTESESFGSKLTGMGKMAALGLGAAGVGGALAVAKIGWDEYAQSAKVAAQTNAVLKSTGGIANITAKGVDNLAQSIMRKTGIDDEEIKASENMLLTFTNVRNEAGKGNDVFTRATQTVTDMSVALGESGSSAAIQLGKALNDPIKGITALQRVGVSFTQTQRDQIQAMVDSGNTMGAQKMILGELSKEFGGSATAAGKTFSGQINILHQEFNNWAGDLVAKVIPYLTRLLTWIQANWPTIRDTIKQGFDAIRPVLVAFGELVVAVVQKFRDHWSQIRPIVMNVAAAIGDAVKIITAALQLVADVLHGRWGAAWQDARHIVSAFVDGIDHELRALVGIVKGVMSTVGSAVVSGLKAPINGLIALLDAFHIAIGKVEILGHTVFGGMDWHPFHIAPLAQGGIVTKPTLALIGEAGPEAVVPLSGRGAGPGLAPRMAGGGDGVTVNVNFNGSVFGDRAQVARELAYSIRDELARIGTREPTIFTRPGVVA